MVKKDRAMFSVSNPGPRLCGGCADCWSAVSTAGGRAQAVSGVFGNGDCGHQGMPASVPRDSQVLQARGDDDRPGGSHAPGGSRSPERGPRGGERWHAYLGDPGTLSLRGTNHHYGQSAPEHAPTHLYTFRTTSCKRSFRMGSFCSSSRMQCSTTYAILT